MNTLFDAEREDIHDPGEESIVVAVATGDPAVDEVGAVQQTGDESEADADLRPRHDIAPPVIGLSSAVPPRSRPDGVLITVPNITPRQSRSNSTS